MADYRNIIAFIKEKEGGLSHNQNDSARFDPVPDGTGTHTNKGITWKTFKAMAFLAQYEPTSELFYKMPDDIWGKIFKIGYWDKIWGDKIISQSIANTWVDWAWGSGPGTAVYKMQQFLGSVADHRMGPNTLDAVNTYSSKDDREFNKRFSDYKLAWYLSLPNQEANYAGWKNRLTSLYAVTDKQTLNNENIA